MNSPSATESIQSTDDERHDHHDAGDTNDDSADELEAFELTAVVTGRPLPASFKRAQDDDVSSNRRVKARTSIDDMTTLHERAADESLEPATLQQLQMMSEQAHNPNATSRNLLELKTGGANFNGQHRDLDTLIALSLQGGTSGPPIGSTMPHNTLLGSSPAFAPASQQQPLPLPPFVNNNLLMEQSLRNQQQISQMLAQLGGSPHLDVSSAWGGAAHMDSSNPQLLQLALLQQQQQQAPSLLPSLSVQQQLDLLLAHGGGGTPSQTLNTNPRQNLGSSDLAALLRHANNNSDVQQANPLLLPVTNSVGPLLRGGIQAPSPDLAVPAHHPPVQLQQRQDTSKIDTSLTSDATAQSSPSPLGLPPCYQGPLEHWSAREFFTLGIDEDPNWLSEFHCFVRTDLVELFRAGHEDVKLRNNAIVLNQLGMRCRYCAHRMASGRSGRSSAFPSSLRQIYQSFTMMLRDHFSGCEAIPSHLLERFLELKDRPAQGATDSKRYWIYSAMKLGMMDTKRGIFMTEASRANGSTAAPFGTNPSKAWDDGHYASIPLVLPSDKPLITEFLYLVMSQVQPIRLLESECIGNRRSLRVGLPGFGCRYCCQHRRLGLCRMFPARRRTLPSKIADIFDHLRRCTLCPDNVKEQLLRMQHQLQAYQADRGSDRDFFDRVWSRLGHDGQSA